MPGLATVVARIRSDIDRGTDFDGRIKQAIEDAIHYYRGARFGFNTKRKDFVVSAEYTSLTANWLEADVIALERSAAYVNPLIEKPYTWIHSEKRDPDYEAEPQFFAIQNRQLRLYPAPDQTYSLQMSYLYDLQDVSISASDSAENAWLNEGLELIRAHATVDLLENYIDGPDAMAKAERIRLRERQEEKQLKRRANREQGGGMVLPWL